MILHIYPLSDIPIYTQIANQIILGIAKGDLKPGSQLPSVRALAADLGINMHTVNKSYHDLEKKGIIEIIPKSGAVICDIPNGTSKETTERIVASLKNTFAEGLVTGMKPEQIKQITSKILEELST